MIADVPLGDVIIWIGALCNLLFPIPMIIATAQGEQRPSRVSFFMWTTEAAIAFAASAAAGASIGALVVSGAAAGVLGAVFAATFVPQLRGRHVAVDPAPWWQAWVDRLCLTVCALALVGWWLTSNPLVALVLAITTDAVAAIPTFVRGWRGEEDWFPYLGFAINAACAFVVITDWALAQWAFTYYQLVVCVLLTLVPLVRNEPGGGAHGRPVRARRWGPSTAAAGGVFAILAAGAVVAGILPRPTGSTPPVPVVAASAPAALVLNPAAVAGDLHPVAVDAVAVPTVTAHVPVPPTPGYIQMAPNGRYALITHRTQMTVSVFDTRLAQVTTTIPTPQAPPRFVTFCPTAEDRAAGRSGDRAYISMFDDPADRPASGQNRHLIGVLDTTTNEMVATIPVGSRPYAAACSPDGRQLWVPSHDESRVDVIDTATNQVVRSLPVPPNPHWLAFSRDGRKVYAACHDSNLVAVLDTVAFTVARTIPVGASPHSTSLSPDGRSLAVVNYSSSEVSIIDTERDVEVKRLPTGENPQDVAWSADGRLVYTANVDGQVNGRPVGNLSVINVATGGQTRLVTDDPNVDSAPTSIARSADGSTGYVTNLRTGTVTVYALGR
ncbi:MAG: serine/threonine protein kinase, bacterial [Pseudonocardiales bacterium]|nr:serine/threonine protein kinase, bacterial [Pseudonocardiales bacterium]